MPRLLNNNWYASCALCIYLCVCVSVRAFVLVCAHARSALSPVISGALSGLEREWRPLIEAIRARRMTISTPPGSLVESLNAFPHRVQTRCASVCTSRAPQCMCAFAQWWSTFVIAWNHRIVIIHCSFSRFLCNHCGLCPCSCLSLLCYATLTISHLSWFHGITHTHTGVTHVQWCYQQETTFGWLVNERRLLMISRR